MSASYNCSAELKDAKNWGCETGVSSRDELIYGAKTYVASYKFVLREEAVIRWLFVREVFTEREEILEVVSDNFQAG